MTKRELIEALEALECSDGTLIVVPEIDGQGTWYVNGVITIVLDATLNHIQVIR